MSARRKLNVAFFNGSVVVAVIVGLLFGSWVAFAIVLVVLLIGNLLMGEIRPSKRDKKGVTTVALGCHREKGLTGNQLTVGV